MHPPTLQDPSSDDIDSMVASLYRLLASSANVLGACTPPSALGAGWIQSTTEVAVLSAVSGAGTTQPVTSCDSEWGAAVAAQVREGGVQQLLKGEKCMASLWEAGCGTTAGSMAKQVRSGCIDSLRVAAVEWTHPVPQCSDWNNVELEHVQLTYSYTMSCLPAGNVCRRFYTMQYDISRHRRSCRPAFPTTAWRRRSCRRLPVVAHCRLGCRRRSDGMLGVLRRRCVPAPQEEEGRG